MRKDSIFRLLSQFQTSFSELLTFSSKSCIRWNLERFTRNGWKKENKLAKKLTHRLGDVMLMEEIKAKFPNEADVLLPP